METSIVLALFSCMSLAIIAVAVCIIAFICRDRVKSIEANSSGFKASFFKSGT